MYAVFDADGITPGILKVKRIIWYVIEWMSLLIYNQGRGVAESVKSFICFIPKGRK